MTWPRSQRAESRARQSEQVVICFRCTVIADKSSKQPAWRNGLAGFAPQFNVSAVPAKDTTVDNGQTLQQLLTERVAIFAQSDRPKEIIDANVEKLFKEVIADLFRSYGDLGQAISESVKKALPGNVDNCFELARYNDLVATALRERWASSGVTGSMLQNAQQAITDAMKDVEIPKTVSLRALLDQFAEKNREEAMQEQWDAPRIDFENPHGEGFLHIYFDPEPESSYATRSTGSRYGSSSSQRSVYRLKCNLGVHIKGTNEQGHRFGDVYTAKIDDEPLGRRFRLHSEWERLIGALYFGGSQLVIDCEPDDISYGIYD